MNNQIEHSDNQSLRDEETVEAGTFWYHIPHRNTYLCVNSNLIDSYDGFDVPDRVLFSLEQGIIFSFESTFGNPNNSELGVNEEIYGKHNFTKVVRPFTITPFPINE